MAWWKPLASVGSALGIGAEGSRIKSEMRRNDRTRASLASMLFERANEDPMDSEVIQSALGQLNMMLDRQASEDEAMAARYGMQGGEMEIAQAANRGRAFADAYTGIAGQAGQLQLGSLGQAMNAQSMVDAATFQKKQMREQKIAGYANMLFKGASAVASGGTSLAAGG